MREMEGVAALMPSSLWKRSGDAYECLRLLRRRQEGRHVFPPPSRFIPPSNACRQVLRGRLGPHCLHGCQWPTHNDNNKHQDRRSVFIRHYHVHPDLNQKVSIHHAAIPQPFAVVNFYYLLDIDDPHHEASRHLLYMQGRDIRGRIYISHQGINAQYSGPLKDALAYVKWVKEDARFADMFVQVSSSVSHAFPRLKLRYKPSLVQIEGGTSGLPLTDPSLRAIPLTPNDWKKKLDRPDVFLLDVRNGYEWDVGHFRGAQRPEVDCFKNTGFGEGNGSDPLAGLDKESTNILMYCTGGIRCDVYSTILRRKGFRNLYSLQGGVARYLIEEGPENWLGNLFVFDSRLAVPPKCYKSVDTRSNQVMKTAQRDTSLPFASCQLCRQPLLLLRHRNCANLDCNKLHLACDDCSEGLQGCCSVQCTSAKRLRPFFSIPQRYQRWHNYRPKEQMC